MNSTQSALIEQLIKEGIRDQKVLEAIASTPRHLFVPEELKDFAYENSPLPIGYDQTISQPFIVAFMTEISLPEENAKVLEIGTGSGYQAAVLAKLCKEIYTIERIQLLGEKAAQTLKNLKNIHIRIGDGYQGWPEYAPFDIIIVTAAPKSIPNALIEQLKIGGRLIIPVGTGPYQELLRITKTNKGLSEERLLPVRFVPMVKTT